MVVAGVPEAAIILAFEQGDLENLQEDIMAHYWRHVRDLLRRVPVFNRKLEFLANFFERPSHEILDAIATAHFPQLTVAYTQPNHNLLRQWINELYRSAKDQLEGAV